VGPRALLEGRGHEAVEVVELPVLGGDAPVLAAESQAQPRLLAKIGSHAPAPPCDRFQSEEPAQRVPRLLRAVRAGVLERCG
jgi:hypothetical protein